jgi:acetyl-CoA synthetase
VNSQQNIAVLCTTYQCQQGNAHKTALRWVDAEFVTTDYTFAALEQQSNRYANLLQNLGYGKGDRIFLYLPPMPEVYFSFLGILKRQAVAGLLFSNFGRSAVFDRLSDAGAKVLITKQSLLRRIRDVIDGLPSLELVLLVDADEDEDAIVRSLPALLAQASDDYETPLTTPDTPSVLHYTSGSTGKPKGVLHVHGGISHQQQTVKEVLQLESDDLFWCTADHGWVTGTTYGITAPWSLGHSLVQFGGTFNAEDWFRVVEEQKITVWYTAPTALRMLMREEDKIKGKFDLSALKRMYSVGEPLNPEIIHWVKRTLDKDIYDTWFQTETGAHMIVNRPGLPVKPGSMGKPVGGIQAAIFVDGERCQTPDTVGSLCLTKGWPSMFVTYLNMPEAYAAKFKGDFYETGDLAKVDADGYFWFVGRGDDVMNPSGHLVGPFEVESALLELPEIIDAAVIGAPDPLLYEKVVAFITLKPGLAWDRKLEIKCRIHISNRLSPIAVPSEYHLRESLPKNRSGKIMRRVLKAEYLGEDLGDISTLEV